MSSIRDICCLCMPNTPFSAKSTHLFHLENYCSLILRFCGSELEEWVGTRFMPDQSTYHLPETCDLSWASGSFTRNLSETPKKRHSLSVEILKPVEGKLASQPCAIFTIAWWPPIREWSQLRETLNQRWRRFLITTDPVRSTLPLVFLVMWAKPPLCLIELELSFKTRKAESWVIPPPSS